MVIVGLLIGVVVFALKMAADFVYIHGHPTKTTVAVVIPSWVDANATYIENRTINIGLRTDEGVDHISAVTKGALVPNLDLLDTEGNYVLVVESTPDGKINISKKV